MPVYNFLVKETVSFFIQRECSDDEGAQWMAEELESEGYVDINERMRSTEIEPEYDLEVVTFGKDESNE